MKWLLIGLAVFAVLSIVGYFLGPQGLGRAITKRDEEILDRRAAGNTPMERKKTLDAIALASTAVENARTLVGSGLSPDAALIQSLGAMIKRPPRTDFQKVEMANTIATINNFLVQQGVLNAPTDAQLEAAARFGFDIVNQPGKIVEIWGVRNLDAWP